MCSPAAAKTVDRREQNCRARGPPGLQRELDSIQTGPPSLMTRLHCRSIRGFGTVGRESCREPTKSLRRRCGTRGAATCPDPKNLRGSLPRSRSDTVAGQSAKRRSLVPRSRVPCGEALGSAGETTISSTETRHLVEGATIQVEVIDGAPAFDSERANAEPLAATIRCTLAVDYPHPSSHVSGTINVVSRFSCTSVISYVELHTSLNRNSPTFNS